MSGIRIRHQHPNARGATLRLVDPNRPMRIPHECPQCHEKHPLKTYHLVLDQSGATIVSKEIVERLKTFPDNGGFEILEEIADPPPQRIIVGGPVVVDRPDIVDATELQRGR